MNEKVKHEIFICASETSHVALPIVIAIFLRISIGYFHYLKVYIYYFVYNDTD